MLLIQNDIGTTDAHVLVVRVEASAVSVTYTDVHLPRLRFFQGLFRRWPVAWSEPGTRRAHELAEGEDFYLTTGVFASAEAAALEAFLDWLGSRIVFLIDWNKARKRLCRFVSKREAIALLDWAAEQDIGHRGWLALGGEQLIFEAMEAASSAPPRYGESLADVVGEERAVDFLKFVLGSCAQALAEGGAGGVPDRLRAELVNLFRSNTDRILDLLSAHAGLIGDLAGLVQTAILRLDTPAVIVALAERSKRWESDADRLVERARALVARTTGTAAFRAVAEAADDAADALEEGVFLLTLLPDPAAATAVKPSLGRLAALLADGSRELVKAFEIAPHVHRGAVREDVADFLAAIECVRTIEHHTDRLEREAIAALIGAAVDPRALFVLARVAQALEGAADALQHAALLLRDHVLGDGFGS